MKTCALVSVLSTHVVYIDHYNAAPAEYDLLATFGPSNNGFVKNSLLIRIFGTTPNGQKTCVHVHQVFI
jgi:DNA polymerase zeta